MLGPARLVNFGVSAGHIAARMRVLDDRGFLLPTGPARGAASPSEVADGVSVLDRGLAEDGVAVGLGPAYTPGASREEIVAMLKVAARSRATVHVHLGGVVPDPSSLFGLLGRNGPPVHVAHINSTAGDDVGAWLGMLREARARGLDVTTEAYPYTAGATLIQSASDGIVHVLMSGVPVVQDGTFADRALFYRQRVPMGLRMPSRPIRAAVDPAAR